MPIYEYNCHRCGEKFEVRQRFSDEPVKVHEKCGGEVERLVSAPSLHFKGQGWYVTDYAKSGHSPANSSANGSSDTKSEAKSDSKTETTKSGTSKSDTAAAPAKTSA